MDAAGPGSGAPRAEDRPPLGEPVAPRWDALRLAITALGSFVAAVLVSTAVVVALGLRGRPPQERTPEEILILAVLSDGALVLVLFLLGRRLLRVRASDLGLRRPSVAALAFAALVAGGLWLASIAVNALQVRALGPNPQSLVVSVGAHSGPVALLMDLATGAIVAPFAEELLYRGLIFGGLAQRVPLGAAAAVSAFLFALSHGLGVIAPIFILGLGLAWIYARTGTLWAAMTAHALVNAISLVLLFVVPRA